MRVQGRIYEDGGFWLVEVPMLDAMTQGTTRDEALVMAKDLVETLVDRPRFSVTVHARGNGDIEIGSDDSRSLVALILKRQRSRSGLSLSEVAQRAGAKSVNAYARFERGDSSPTLEELTALIGAVSARQRLCAATRCHDLTCVGTQRHHAPRPGGAGMGLTIETEREEDGRWIADVPELPGVMVYGTTREEAVVHAEALARRVLAENIEERPDRSH